MQSERWTQGPIGNEPEANRASITDLLRQLASESGNLVRQEMNLAKLEIKDTASQFARDGVKLALGAGLAATGGLALTAFLILVIGNILNGAYWAGALIVGVLFLLVGALIARSGINNMKEQSLKPEETIETLREGKQWLQQEARDLRDETMH